MNKADKEALANKLRSAIEAAEKHKHIHEQADNEFSANYYQGMIAGLMDILNFVRGL